MKRLFIVALVGLSLSTAGLSQAKKEKKEKASDKKEATSSEKIPVTKKPAEKTPVETRKTAKTEVLATAPSVSSTTENILIFNADRGKTRGKLVVAMEKSPDFAKTPKLLGRYQVRPTQRTEEPEKDKKAHEKKKPVPVEDKVRKPASSLPPTHTGKEKNAQDTQTAPAKQPEKASTEPSNAQEDGEN